MDGVGRTEEADDKAPVGLVFVPIAAAEGARVRIGFRLAGELGSRAVFLVRGTFRGEPVHSESGLFWSDSLGSDFMYVPEGTTQWLSRAVTFGGEIDTIGVSLLTWPRPVPVSPAPAMVVAVATDPDGVTSRAGISGGR